MTWKRVFTSSVGRKIVMSLTGIFLIIFLVVHVSINACIFNTLVDETKPLLVKNKLAKKGDNIVIVSGVPFGKVKSSNVILVETI